MRKAPVEVMTFSPRAWSHQSAKIRGRH